MRRLGGSETGSTWRLAAGAALVSGGILTTALGTAHVTTDLLQVTGVGSGPATVLGLSVGGMVIPSLLYTVHTRLPPPRPYDRTVAIGTVIAAVGVGVVVGVTTLTAPLSILTALAAMPYAAGVVLALWGLVGSAGTRSPNRTPTYQRSTDNTDQPAAADGGEDDDLTSPLEDP